METPKNEGSVKEIPLDVRQEIYEILVEASKLKEFNEVGKYCVCEMSNNRAFALYLSTAELIHIVFKVDMINVDTGKHEEKAMIFCLERNNLKLLVE